MVDNLLGFHCSLLLIFVCACTHVGVCICVCAPVSACVQRSGIHVGHCLSGSVLLVSFFFFLFFPCMLEFNPLRQVNQMHEALLFFFLTKNNTCWSVLLLRQSRSLVSRFHCLLDWLVSEPQGSSVSSSSTLELQKDATTSFHFIFTCVLGVGLRSCFPSKHFSS